MEFTGRPLGHRRRLPQVQQYTDEGGRFRAAQGSSKRLVQRLATIGTHAFKDEHVVFKTNMHWHRMILVEAVAPRQR